jgi:hypothetical protein
MKAIWEYIKDVKWKKSEFLSKEVKEFQNDENIKMVFQLLDWNKRKVKLKTAPNLISSVAPLAAMRRGRRRSPGLEPLGPRGTPRKIHVVCPLSVKNSELDQKIIFSSQKVKIMTLTFDFTN